VKPLVGRALVAAQFALLGLLAWRAAQGDGPAWAAVPVLAGVVLGAWALAHNRPGNFNVLPVPRHGGRLVTSGPYRWIRHPMYSALLLAGAAADALAWAALLAVLAAKALLEERGMRAAHPGYAAYCAGTRRFVPGVW
jgi:protein-S-isoprenylcysteine O-methyltransferase Ste14